MPDRDALAELALADRIRGIATEGLSYAKDPYDIARYKKLLELAAETYGHAFQVERGILAEWFSQERGCLTPKLGIDVAVVDTDKKLLVLDRANNTGWCLPCGWNDIGESPAQTAARETREETGIAITIDGYLAVTTKGPSDGNGILHQVNLLMMSAPVAADTPVTLSHEHKAFRWLRHTEIQTLEWHPGHENQVRRCFAFLSDDKQTLLPLSP